MTADKSAGATSVLNVRLRIVFVVSPINGVE